MGNLLDKLLSNAEKAKKENEFLEECRSDLEKIKKETEEKIQSLKEEKDK